MFGYGECMMLNDELLLSVPNALPIEHAALTEPMVVGLHAVVRGQLGAGGAPWSLGAARTSSAHVSARWRSESGQSRWALELLS